MIRQYNPRTIVPFPSLSLSEKWLRLRFRLIDAVFIPTLLLYNLLATAFVSASRTLSNKRFFAECSSLSTRHLHRTIRCNTCKRKILPYQHVCTSNTFTIDVPFHKRKLFGAQQNQLKLYPIIICDHCSDLEKMEFLL